MNGNGEKHAQYGKESRCQRQGHRERQGGEENVEYGQESTCESCRTREESKQTGGQAGEGCEAGRQDGQACTESRRQARQAQARAETRRESCREDEHGKQTSRRVEQTETRSGGDFREGETRSAYDARGPGETGGHAESAAGAQSRGTDGQRRRTGTDRDTSPLKQIDEASDN